MGNYQTITAIADNLEIVLKGMGINFTRKAYDDMASIPTAILPLGEITYNGESFEHPSGQKSGYAEADYRLKVIIKESDARDMQRVQMKWVHLIRDGLTVNALNIGSLVSSKLVSNVLTEAARPNNTQTDGIGAVEYDIKIRYREAA